MSEEIEYFDPNDGYQITTIECNRYFGPEWLEEQADNKGIVLPRGLYKQNGKIEWIMRLVLAGHGTNYITRTTSSTHRTVRKYRDILQKLSGMEIKCPCGKPAAHLGFCKYKCKLKKEWWE